MANQIILKRSSTPGKVPTTSQLALGEIGINTNDGLIYIKKDDGTASVVQIGGITSVNTKTGAVTLTTTDIAEGTAQYFTNARARSAVNGGTGITYSSTTGAIAVDTTTIATRIYVDDAVTALVASAPATLNTLNELAAALNSDADFSTTVANSIGTKLAKASNLSDLVSASAARTNLGLATVAATGAYADLSGTPTNADYRGAVSFVAGSGAYNSTTGVFTIPTNTSQLTNGAGFATTSYVDTAVAGKDNTDEITEGTTNLFFTNARARGAVSASGSLSYNSTTGVISYTTPSTTGITEGTNLYFTSARARAAFEAGTGITVTGGLIATTITQYTDALARAALSGSTGISYNSTTGAIASTITQYTDAMAKAAITAGTGITVTAGVVATTITQYTDALATTAARAAHSAGAGISYNSTTGAITSTITQYTDALAVSANTSAIATAKAEAIASAASDATTKAATAKSEAIAAVTNGAGAAFDTLKEIQDLMATDTELSSAIAAISNVPSATKLATARAIQGVNFDGTAAITVVTAGTGISVSGTAVSSTITQYTDALATTAARAAVSFTAGSGAYNSTTGVITIPTNNNQLTNGNGYYSSGSAPSFGATSTGALTVTGSITASGEITAYFSDERLKQDIAPITGALDKVMAIGGYTYKANDLAHELGVSRYDNQIGLLAGEVEAVMPELVTQSALAGYKTIRYDKVVSVLVEAIKEQQAMIEELRRDVKKTLS
jgi:hypothetical protein